MKYACKTGNEVDKTKPSSFSRNQYESIFKTHRQQIYEKKILISSHLWYISNIFNFAAVIYDDKQDTVCNMSLQYFSQMV